MRYTVYISKEAHTLLHRAATRIGHKPSWIVQHLIVRYTGTLVRDYAEALQKAETPDA